MQRFARVVVAAALLTAGLQVRIAFAQSHPLDPLSRAEHWDVLDILQRENRLNADTQFYGVSLVEPDKADVWSFSTGDDFERRALAIVYHDGERAEAVVDLNRRSLERWTVLDGVHPQFLNSEYFSFNGLIKAHPDFIAAMRARGIDDLTFVDCLALPPSYFGTAEQRGRRIAHANCEYPVGVQNSWTRKIAGLTIVIDVDAREVLRVVDEGVVPIADTNADYDRAALGPPREVPGPLLVSRPAGSGFAIDGHVIEWQKWRFHLRSDSRVGPVVSTVTYNDDGVRRPVLYQGNLSEIFVPYMDPSFVWSHRTFLDAGEFSAGGLTKPLAPGVDCPDHAAYMHGLVVADSGRPELRENVICIFEREPGDASWRHSAASVEGRRKRDLVVRSAAVLGNYDYVLDWTFQQDGSIRVAVGATGIVEVDPAIDATAGSGDDDRYGRFVDRHIVAINHDHYFSFRLDLDVDGATNRFVVDRLVPTELPADNPRRSIWVNEPVFPARESDAQLNIDLKRPALWRVLSDSKRNAVGNPTSFQLSWGKTAETLLAEDDLPRQRAGFIDHHLWVTAYDPDERYAAGDYPMLSEPGMGLPEWTSANRRIQNTDIVLWHTIGMHHLVRAEDWPVMPVLWHSFELRPFDFFDRNPALDLPE